MKIKNYVKKLLYLSYHLPSIGNFWNIFYGSTIDLHGVILIFCDPLIPQKQIYTFEKVKDKHRNIKINRKKYE